MDPLYIAHLRGFGHSEESYARAGDVEKGALIMSFLNSPAVLRAAVAQEHFTVTQANEKYLPQLEAYIARGNILRSLPLVRTISADVQASIANQESNINPFYFVEASSGMGKSQLAESLNLPVIYIPLDEGQDIYQCFQSVKRAVSLALEKDMYENFDASAAKLNEMRESKTFWTVGLLLGLFEKMVNKTNEESIRLMSGTHPNETLTFEYQASTITNARRILYGYVEDGTNTCPCFFIDEVPPESNEELFAKCILLRNLIRCMNAVCILSGTEVDSRNKFDTVVSKGSYCTIHDEYVRLILRLPLVQWEIFEQDEKYQSIMGQLHPSLIGMLKQSRPRFVQQILTVLVSSVARESSQAVSSATIAMGTHLTASDVSLGLACQAGISESPASSSNIGGLHVTAAVLSQVKWEIVQYKANFASSEGLFAQMSLMLTELIARSISTTQIEAHMMKKRKIQRSNVSEDAACVKRQQYCLRHHFAKLDLSSFSNETIIGLSVKTAGTKSYFVDNSGKKFVSNIIFDPPSIDPLLYLICLRDGIYFEGTRVSCSFARVHIIQEKLLLNNPIVTNPEEPSCSGRLLEAELSCALIVASHSHTSLCGCPLGEFLPKVVAELYYPVEEGLPQYLAPLPIRDVPDFMNRILVGPLSSISSSWGQHTDPLNTIPMTDIRGSTNMDKKNASFAVIVDGVVCPAAGEAKCTQTILAVREVVKSINNHLETGQLLTIMAVTLAAGEYQSAAYEAAKEKVNLAKIIRSASEAGDQLVLVPLSEQYSETKTTVIMVVLEAIYPGRQEALQSIYNQT